jgi:F-type H+-transporting ATPase subunit b
MANIALLAEEAGASPNPLIPETYDIVWSLVCLVIVFLVFWKWVLPMASRVLNERTEKIDGGIARAEAAQAEAQAALEQYRAQLAEARSEAARIREDARTQGQQIIDEMKKQAQQESDRIVAAGHSQLVAQRQQIVAELRSDLGRTSIDLAEKVLGASLSDDAKRSSTIDRFLDELDAVSASTSTGK